MELISINFLFYIEISLNFVNPHLFLISCQQHLFEQVGTEVTKDGESCGVLAGVAVHVTVHVRVKESGYQHTGGLLPIFIDRRRSSVSTQTGSSSDK